MDIIIRKIVKTQNRIVLPKEFKEGDVVEIKKINLYELTGGDNYWVKEKIKNET